MTGSHRRAVSRGWLLQPRSERARGHVREGIEAIQTELVADLQQVDAEVERLMARRNEIVAELRRCRDALGGIGHKRLRRFPLPGDVDAIPAGTAVITSGDLRETRLDGWVFRLS
jgi:hypothetical protein